MICKKRNRLKSLILSGYEKNEFFFAPQVIPLFASKSGRTYDPRINPAFWSQKAGLL
jgi:hypothetical protein